eukprot:761137_1
MPVFLEKYNGEDIMKKRKKKVKKSGDKKNRNTVNTQKLKKNNFDGVANADDRGKIFGSRYLDRNSKKNVFKIPRGDGSNKKRKDDDMSGFVLENVQPQKKKRKLSKLERKEYRLEKSRQEERMNKVNAVDNEWPIDEINRNMEKKNDDKRDENNRDRNKNDKREEDDDDDDVEITETDML